MKNKYLGSVGKYCNGITIGAEAYNVFLRISFTNSFI